MGAAAANQLDHPQRAEPVAASPQLPAPEPLRTDLVVITAQVPRHVREALHEMSKATGVPMARLLRRGLERVLVNPPVVVASQDEQAELDLEDAALELRAQQQMAEARRQVAAAKRVLRRIAAWRKKRASMLEASAKSELRTEEGGSTAT